MKVLIFSMTVGEGHNSIAKAMSEEFDKRNIENKTVQIFGYDEKLVAAKNKEFLRACKYIPHLYDFAWNILRKKKRSNDKISHYSKICYDYVEKNVAEFQPDIIICTHLYASAVISDLKKKGKLNSVVTSTILFDFCLAPSWEKSNGVDFIFQPLQNTTQDLLNIGYHQEQIKTFGLPVKEQFASMAQVDKTELKNQMGLQNKFTVMTIGGGNGLGNTFKMIKSILNKNLDINVIVVNGKNKKSFDKIQSYIDKNNVKNVINLGFINNVAQYMRASDIIISRCGGCGISEIMSLGVPFIIREKLIINEKINKKYFISLGAAIGMNKITDAGSCVEKMLNDKELYSSMQNTVAKLSTPYAAKDVADFLISQKQSLSTQ